MKIEIEKIIMCGFFIALGVLIMPIFHIVGLVEKFVILNFIVLICGFTLGWPYGLACGLLMPLAIHFSLRGTLTVYPDGVALMIELGVCGLASGVIYSFNVIKNNILNIYFTLIATILIERVVGGLFKIVVYAISDIGIYGIKELIRDFFVTPIFGIILLILVVPAVVLMFEKKKNIRVKKIC